jgi:dienelactone hydrolase
MREYPVFVPFGDEHLAAVIAVPDDPIDGLVLLTTGTGAPRSHRFQVWARTARALAERGVASVRMEYLGIGDSTGRMLQPSLGDQRRDQAIAVARFALEAVGTDRLAVAGNCSGSIVALDVAAQMDTCRGAVLILPRLIRPTGLGRAVIGSRGGRLSAAVRSNRAVYGALRRAISPYLRGESGRNVPMPSVAQAIERAVGHARLLFVYAERDSDVYLQRSVALLPSLVEGLPAARRERVEVRLVPFGPLSGFESIEAQEGTVELVTGWIDACFRGEPQDAAEGRLTLRGSGP